jgi:hypothetical protein
MQKFIEFHVRSGGQRASVPVSNILAVQEHLDLQTEKLYCVLTIMGQSSPIKETYDQIMVKINETLNEKPI